MHVLTCACIFLSIKCGCSLQSLKNTVMNQARNLNLVLSWGRSKEAWVLEGKGTFWLEKEPGKKKPEVREVTGSHEKRAWETGPKAAGGSCEMILEHGTTGGDLIETCFTVLIAIFVLLARLRT